MSNVQFTILSILQMPKNRERVNLKLSGLMYDSCPLLQYCHVILSYDLVVLAVNTKVEPRVRVRVVAYCRVMVLVFAGS